MSLNHAANPCDMAEIIRYGVYMAAEPSRLPKEKIASIAEAAAGEYSYTKDFNIDRVVEELGGRIFFNDFWEDKAKTGSLVVYGLRKFEIFVPSYTTPERDRFTIAHELGHYILHYLPNIDSRQDSIEAPFEIDRYGDSAIEAEANLFAAAFLMPVSQFQDEFRRQQGNLALVASKFHVSETAARVRAKTLGLLGDQRSAAAASSPASVSPA